MDQTRQPARLWIWADSLLFAGGIVVLVGLMFLVLQAMSSAPRFSAWTEIGSGLGGVLVFAIIFQFLTARSKQNGTWIYPPIRKVLLTLVLPGLLLSLGLIWEYTPLVWGTFIGLLGLMLLLNSKTKAAEPSDFRFWLDSYPALLSREEADWLEAEFFMTGADLINRIVRSIELGQSVVLAGPRGCGKSYCVGQAIKEAARRGLIPPGASVFVQGNREIPRDYLAEDDIGFRIEQAAGEASLVTPYRRSAPLFSFARRDPATGDPILSDPISRKVECEIEVNGTKQECRRFVLFLDEINRFSDGVLDSLLSILEERRTVLSGREYELPVVVCMTMNPPGYDGSARKLSPPLAARIGRSYRLRTPDLDTLGDQIIERKIHLMQKEYEEACLLKKIPAGSHPDSPAFPTLSPLMIRKVGLLTLCLWGDVREHKAGTEYLTEGTRDLLIAVMESNQEIAKHMKAINGLCRFGPDGRAGADWLVTAIGVALEQATRNRWKEAHLTPEHLIDTVVESVAHKIYDSFSQGSRPDLTAKKETAVRSISWQIFRTRSVDGLISRTVDQAELLTKPFQHAL